MKPNIFVILSLLISFVFTGCEKDLIDEQIQKPVDEGEGNISGDVPEGYFVVDFSPGWEATRGAVTGADLRVRNLRYLIYDTLGTFVKEKLILSTSGYTVWPLAAVNDTLPKGSYTAVFLGNVEKTFFPYPVTGGPDGYTDILTNYQGKMVDARIVLPNGPFTDATEFYWAKVPFSNTNSQPTILLQRIIGMFNVHRNFVDAQTALNGLTRNVFTRINADNIINNQVNATLPGLLRGVLDRTGITLILSNPLLGLSVTSAVDSLVHRLVVPVTNALDSLLIKNIVNQLGGALTGNATHQGALDGLGALLNPWNNATAQTAVVTIRNFPKTMNFSLTVQDYYTGDHDFQYDFTTTNIYDEKDILIRGFNGLFDIRQIRVSSNRLVGGILVDGIVDGSLLLNGTFVNVTDPVQATVGSNKRYKANYSFLDLSYTQGAATQPLTLSVRLGDVANLDNLLSPIPILGPLLSLVVLGALGDIKVEVPINVPILGANNLTLSGSWNTPAPY